MIQMLKKRFCSLFSFSITFLRYYYFLQIYDIQTGQKTLTLNNPDLANNYKRNCATFNPTDDLVLNDGVLWDVRSAQAIHKFDKFNMNISGVFHPNSLEVIINTEIVSFQRLVVVFYCLQPHTPFIYKMKCY